MLSRYGFVDKAEPMAASVIGGKTAEGKNRRYESKEEVPTVLFRSPDTTFWHCVSE